MAVLYDLTASLAKHKVFISYSHDSESHRAAVKQLADTIAEIENTDCALDQYVPGEHPIEGWPRWMEQQFESATRVLCICTPRYKRIVSGDATISSDKGRGAHWESEIFLAELYREKSNSKKIKAVLARGANSDSSLPNWLVKWGALDMPLDRGDASYRRLIAYITDAAASPGPGIPHERSLFDTLADLEVDYLNWQVEDTRRAVENIKIFGMAAPIKLRSIYYPTVLSTTIGRRLYDSEWQRAGGGAPVSTPLTGLRRRANYANYVKGDEFIAENKRVVVLGGPGAGKTTFLRSLAQKYCDYVAINANGIEGSLAIYVHLPSLKLDGFDLINEIDKQIATIAPRFSSVFSAICRRLPITLLLDSLDEVPAANRQVVFQGINTLDRALPLARIVVSCRTADYIEVLDNFIEVEVARLTSDAITRIVRAWFSESGAESGERLLKLIDGDVGVKSLTETPLLLSLLCIQFRHDLDLPKRKIELYSRCVSALLRDWDSQRLFRRQSQYEKLTDDRKERLFEQVAGHFFLSGERYDLPVPETEAVVGLFIERCQIEPCHSAAVLREIESLHGVIERLSRDHYCFSHNTFHEYFAARRIVALREELKHVQENLDKDSWEPVIEFIVGLLDEPMGILQLLIKESTMTNLSNYPAMARRTKVLTLLYRCITASPLLGPDQMRLVANHLVDSHYQMARIYGRGGVYPFATLRSEGIAHTFVWTNRRPTLAEALKPFRRLSNLIYATHSPVFVDTVIKKVDQFEWKADIQGKFNPHVAEMICDTLAVSLLVPISSASPEPVILRLSEIIERSKSDFVKRTVAQTVRRIASNHSV